MSRGSNRNKIGSSGSKKSKGKHVEGSPIISIRVGLGILVSIALVLLACISSSSNLKEALTMINPGMNRNGEPSFNRDTRPGGKREETKVQPVSLNRSKDVGVPLVVGNPEFPKYDPAVQNEGEVYEGVEAIDQIISVPRGEGNLVIRVQDESVGASGQATVEWMAKDATSRDLKTGDRIININTNSNSPRSLKSSEGSKSYESIAANLFFHFDHNTGSFRLKDQYATYQNKPAKVMPASKHFDGAFQSSLALSGKYLPSKCKDGSIYGFSDYATLRNAVHEMSTSYSDAVKIYNEHIGAIKEHEQLTIKAQDVIVVEDPPMIPAYISDFLNIAPDPFVICPGAHLRPSIHERHDPIYINAEDMTIQCDSCIIEAPGTHISFGPLAKNILIRGVTLIGATDTSVVFRHDGANASFEDCYFFQNEGVGAHGAVVDVNSTSTVEFHRCEINEFQSGAPRHVGGQQVHALTLRGKS